MNKLTIEDLVKSGELKSKCILVRVDFNVPMSKDDPPQITDDKRIIESLPTIKKIIEQKGKCILMSHLGRPKGQVNLKYSLRPVAMYLSRLLDKSVFFADDCIGSDTEKICETMIDGSITLLENLRFH